MPALLADFREFYSLSAYAVGTDACSWIEGLSLITALIEDPRTRLAQKLCGLKYRTSVKDYILLSVVAAYTSKGNANKLISPFDGAMERAAQNSITKEERMRATLDFLAAHDIQCDIEHY